MARKNESSCRIAAQEAAKPRNHRELGQAILAECDPVKVGCELLNSESESVKARALETFVNWSYGSPAKAVSTGSGGGLRVVWDLLGTPSESPQTQ